MAQLIPQSQGCCDRRVSKYYFEKHFTVQIPPREQWLTQQITLSDEIVCFTDGSHRGLTGPSEAAVYIQDDDHEYIFPLGSVSIVFQTEIFVILSSAAGGKRSESDYLF